MNLKSVFEKVNFFERYKKICVEHNDFDNSMRGNHRVKYDEILKDLGYTFKYYGRESFYNIADKINEFTLTFNLVLKDGMIEPILYIKKNGKLCSPDGILHSMPGQMGIDFDRKKYYLPLYATLEELKEILKDLFSIYEDIKKELANM